MHTKVEEERGGGYKHLERVLSDKKQKVEESRLVILLSLVVFTTVYEHRTTVITPFSDTSSKSADFSVVV